MSADVSYISTLQQWACLFVSLTHTQVKKFLFAVMMTPSDQQKWSNENIWGRLTHIQPSFCVSPSTNSSFHPQRHFKSSFKDKGQLSWDPDTKSSLMTSISTNSKQHFKAASLLFHAKLSLCSMFSSPVKMLSRRVPDLEAGCNLLAAVFLLQESAPNFVSLFSALNSSCFNDLCHIS